MAASRSVFLLVALGLAVALAQDFSAEEDAQLAALLAKKAAAAEKAAARGRRAAGGPQLKTDDGHLVIAVEGDKKVGYKIGGDTVYFNDLPKQYMAEDSKCFSALSIGYTLGQTSPSTVGITDLIKEKIDGSVKTLNAQMSTTLDKTDKDMRKAVADFSTCLAAGKGMKGGKCVPAPWAVSADNTLACDATRDGSLKYDKANTALLICVGSTKQWTRVSPPNPPDLGAFAASAGEDCATIKKKGYSAGSKFYWTKPGGKAALVFCNMKGDGTTEFDGSSKDKPATSCRTIDKYYDALSTTAALKWIKTKGGAIQVICVIANGGVLSFGDGKTKETAAFSCQQILDKFKNLKNNDKRWLIFNKQGSNVASLIQCIVDGKTAYSNPDGLTAAGAADSCEALKQQNKEIKSGNYWVKLKQFGTSQIVTKMVYCEQAWNGGGWTMLYFSTIKQRGANEWSLNWATTTTKGKRFNAAWSTNDNYLMPMHHWYTFNGGDFVFRSSGGKPDGMRLQKWQISPQDKYKMNWNAYKSNGASNEERSLQEHRNRALSTQDRDHDSWGSQCAGRSRSFGWYGACCSLCMTSNSNGSWRNKGVGGVYIPVDWHYRGVNWHFMYARQTSQ